MQDLLAALALVLVIEGMVPFMSPRRWREAMSHLAQQSDQSLRYFGLALMMMGLLGLALVKNL